MHLQCLRRLPSHRSEKALSHARTEGFDKLTSHEDPRPSGPGLREIPVRWDQGIPQIVAHHL